MVRAAPFVLLSGLVTCTPAGPRVGGPAPPPSLERELDAGDRRWVEETLERFTLAELAAQLVMPWIPGAYAATTSPEFQEIADHVRRGVGGLSISIGLPHSYAAKLNELQELADVPLLVTSDFENGGPGMRINHAYALPSLLAQGGGTSFPPTMAFGAIDEERHAYEYGRITAQEARAVGVHLIFSPVLDVNSNPLNPVINTRSFGEDPEAVARLGAAYIRGARAGGALTTAKHFPGHGDTRTDSHVELPVVDADRARLDRVELVPFRRAVEVGVDAVMTAHVAMPGVLGPGAPPATLAPAFMTGLLREEMGFEGLLFTDAIRMAAIMDRYGVGESAVLALEAGADVILGPAAVEPTVEALVAAVESGRVERSRLEASARRILEAKAVAGLHRDRSVDLEAVDERVGVGSHLAFADSAATRSITLPRDVDGLIPLDPAAAGRVLSITWARRDDLVAGRTFDALLGQAVPGVERVRLDEETPGPRLDSLRTRVQAADRVIIGAYVPPRSGSGSVGVPDAFRNFVEVVAAAKPSVVVSFGNPYLLSAFPGIGTYLVAWGPWEVSQAAAVRAVLGRSAITGRLPVSIPPHHEIGDGLVREAVRPLAAPVAGPDPLEQTGMVPRSRADRWEREVGREGDRAGPEAREGAAGADPLVRTVCSTGGAPAAPRRPSEGPCPRSSLVAVSGVEADAAEVDMSAAALQRIDSLILAAVADSATPGAALAVGRNGRLVRLRGYGRLSWDDRSAPATPGSVYDVASLTKVVGTTTAVMLLVERGELDLDRPVVEYLPWWGAGDPDKADVTVRQLLLHRAGLPPFERFYLEMEGRPAYEAAIGGLALDYAPGRRTVYSDIGLMTAGFIVEAVAGRPLDRFLEEEVWRPLGMTDTGFTPDPSLQPIIAPTEVDTILRHQLVHGVVHDENAFALGGVAGHAGLFSSARDLAVFADLMLGGGRAEACRPEPGSGVPCGAPRPEPVRLLDPGTVARFTSRWDSTASRALGWDTPSGDSSSAGDYFGTGAFGHTGFTGTSIWMDPELDLFVVLLTNRVHPTRENTGHVPLRRAVQDAAALAVTDRPVRRRPR